MIPLRRLGRRHHLAAVLAWAGAAVGCGGDPAPAHHRVVIEQLRFEPAVLAVAPGDTVTWTNDDLVPHTVTGTGWDSGELRRGESYTRVVSPEEAAGYTCRYHPTMSGRLRFE